MNLIHKVLPVHNVVPNSCYEAKKIIFDLSLDSMKIHVSINDCVLFRKEYNGVDL